MFERDDVVDAGLMLVGIVVMVAVAMVPWVVLGGF